MGEVNLTPSLTKGDGQLVIVEDYLMPKGEYAHPYGFTLLDTEAIKLSAESVS